jgi:hypothetical protein
MHLPQVRVELPRPLSGLVDDLVDRLQGLIIQTELRCVLFDESVRPTARRGTAEGARSTFSAGSTGGGLREARAGDGHSREQR